MGFIVQYFDWVLYITGALTASMFLMAIMPTRQFKSYFGTEISEPNVIMVVRHWGFMIGVIGLLLIYSGFEPSFRVPILWLAIVGKAAIVTSIVLRLGALKGTNAVQIVIADIIMIALYVIYLVAA